MNEFAVRQVRADVVDPLIAGAEKNQIARLQFLPGHIFDETLLSRGVMRQIQAEKIAVHLPDQARAVRSLSCVASSPVGDSQILLRFFQELVLT